MISVGKFQQTLVELKFLKGLLQKKDETSESEKTNTNLTLVDLNQVTRVHKPAV